MASVSHAEPISLFSRPLADVDSSTGSTGIGSALKHCYAFSYLVDIDLPTLGNNLMQNVKF